MTNRSEAGALERDHYGTPATLQWLLIRPNGTITVRQSDNWMTYFNDPGLWWQSRLERDVHHEVDSFTRGLSTAWSLAIPTARHGVVVVARFDHNRPDNPIATAMLWAVGIDYWVRGAAAWLGEREPATHLHRDLTCCQLRELRTVAAHCRCRLLTGPNPSGPGGCSTPPDAAPTGHHPNTPTREPTPRPRQGPGVRGWLR